MVELEYSVLINNCKGFADFDKDQRFWKNDNLKENDHSSVVSQCYNMYRNYAANFYNHKKE